VKNSARLGRALLALVCFSAVAACSDAQDEKPTYDEAIKNLVADAEAILASDELRRSGSVVATEKAETDQSGQCPGGTARRFYRAQGDLAASYKSPHVVTGLIRVLLGFKHYDHVVDDLEVRDEDLAIVVSRKESVGVTFTMAVRKDKRPNILIIGKTDCFETSAAQ